MEQARKDYRRAYSMVRELARMVEGGEQRADGLCSFAAGRPSLRVQVMRCFLGMPTQSGEPVVFMYGGLAEEMAQTLRGRGVLAMVV